MSEYSLNYRTFSCWECFEARGKMCIDQNYQSMIRETGSSNRGHGICCKSDFYGQYCSKDGSDGHICSDPVISNNNVMANITTGDDDAVVKLNY